MTSFTANTLAQASQVNSNFSTVRTAVNTYCAFLDASSQTFTGNQTFNPTSGVALTVTDGGITVSADGITVTGNSTITGTLGGVTTLTCTTVTATNLGGTLTTAAQPNITSFGTLTSLTIAGALAGVTTLAASDTVTLSKTGGSAITFSGAAPTVRIGATSLLIQNNAGTADLIQMSSANGIALRSVDGARVVDLSYSGGNPIAITNTDAQIELGSISATTDAVNFPAMPSCAGAPTGIPLATSNMCPFVFDRTNNKLYIYDGAWISTAALS